LGRRDAEPFSACRGGVHALLLSASLCAHLSSGCAGPSPPDLYAALLDRSLPGRVAAAQRDGFLDDLSKISAHEHYRAGGSFPAYRKVAAELGIEKVVLLPTGDAPDNRGYREHMASLLELAGQEPDFIVPFATVNPSDADAVAVVEDAVRKGARGLKLMSGHPEFYKAPLDDPPMLAVFEAARVLGIPVLIHVSPVVLPAQIPELEHLLAAFPGVTVVAAHYARMSSDLDQAARLLDTHPNLFMDLSMGRGLPRYQGEIARRLREYRDFILAYQDRLLWGTDLVLGKKQREASIRARIRTDFLLLGTRLYVDPQTRSESTAVEVGLDLPRSVLAKIFSDNPRRILGIR
jgi:predicted TIM-barrel fold metal-dependent hydrolase